MTSKEKGARDWLTFFLQNHRAAEGEVGRLVRPEACGLSESEYLPELLLSYMK